MKPALCGLAGILLLSAGCATNVQTVLRDFIGPCSPAQARGTINGQLVVNSCWDSGLHVDYDYVASAPYDVYSPDGKLVQHVFNDAGGFDRYPVLLTLTTGQYRVSSFVPGLGQTTVLVQINPGQTTTVYLDGSGNHLKKKAPSENLVSLPDGNIAGWRAHSAAPVN